MEEEVRTKSRGGKRGRVDKRQVSKRGMERKRGRVDTVDAGQVRE